MERVVHTFVEQLVRDGHEVTLFATPGSFCSGETFIVKEYNPDRAPSGIRGKDDIISEEPLYLALRQHLKTNRYDVIHDWSFQNLFVLRHPGKIPFLISTCIPPTPNYRRPNLVACSQAHANLCGGSTRHVHYGLYLKEWKYSFKKQNHFIHIAKIARFKAQHLAIFAARKIRRELHLAGNIEDHLYFYAIVKPLLLLSSKIHYLGEINGTNHYLKNALALIQTPQWFDAFPLVILEALASGTPVISLNQGGIPEQIENSVNGFLCKTWSDLTEAMQRVHEIRPQDCLAYAHEYFTVQRMVQNYLQLYQRVLDQEHW